MRMTDTGRAQTAWSTIPILQAVIYHTVKFCDYYGFEYSQLRRELSGAHAEAGIGLHGAEQRPAADPIWRPLPESMAPATTVSERKKTMSGKGLYVGIDSGSTSTDVVILNEKKGDRLPGDPAHRRRRRGRRGPGAGGGAEAGGP